MNRNLSEHRIDHTCEVEGKTLMLVQFVNVYACIKLFYMFKLFDTSVF